MSIEVMTAIYQKLVADANVTGKVGLFNGSEAIFTGRAPEAIGDDDKDPLDDALIIVPAPFTSDDAGTKNANDKSREETCKLTLMMPATFSIVEIENLEKAVRDSLHRQVLATIGSAVMELVECLPGLDMSDEDYFVRALDVRVLARE